MTRVETKPIIHINKLNGLKSTKRFSSQFIKQNSVLYPRDPPLQKKKKKEERKVTKNVKNKGISKVIAGKQKQEVGAMSLISDKIEFRPKIIDTKDTL